MTKRKEQCGSCRHYDGQHSRCNRLPPVPVDGRRAFFPAVAWDDGCGEFQPREVNHG